MANTTDGRGTSALDADLEELRILLAKMQRHYGAYYRIEQWPKEGARMYKAVMTLKVTVAH